MVGVARGGGELGVAEHGADLVQRRAGIGQGGGEGVAQIVDAQISRQAGRLLGPLPRAAQPLQRRSRAAVAGEDEGVGAGIIGRLPFRPRLFQPGQARGLQRCAWPVGAPAPPPRRARAGCSAAGRSWRAAR